MGRHRAALPQQLHVLDAGLRALAARHGGVVTAAQCRGLGGDDGAIRRLIASGAWGRVRRGIYCDRRRAPPAVADAGHHRRCAALLASLRAPAVVSHTSAARLLGLPAPPGGWGGRACVTRRPPAPSNDPLLGDVHVTDYDDADVVLVDGVPVLGGARRVGQPGAPIAGLVVRRADYGGTNWFESTSRWWLLEGGLPRPRLQVPFTGKGMWAEVDMWFPEHRTVGEADGAGKYDEPGALFAEKRREDWLRDQHRVEVVRWVPEEMRTSGGREGVVDRFQRAFARRC